MLALLTFSSQMIKERRLFPPGGGGYWWVLGHPFAFFPNLVLFSCIFAFANTCVDLEDELAKVMGTLLKRIGLYPQSLKNLGRGRWMGKQEQAEDDIQGA